MQAIDGAQLWERFDRSLAPYAQKNQTSLPRQHPEAPDPQRLPFQRDRDRVLHAKAFRRLRGKTQVLPPSHGDHIRNRLSHSLEVSQIARDLARQLQLNEDLAEVIALAHDLGHPPFGHVGERVLNELLAPYEQHFDHNQHSLRLVECLESPYEDWNGLNLTWETREGIQKHERQFFRGKMKIYFPHLESQLVDIADEIAYLSSDIQDGFRGGFFCQEQLESQPLWQLLEFSSEGSLEVGTRLLMRLLINDLAQETLHRLEQQKIDTLLAVQQYPQKLVGFSPQVAIGFAHLKKFLRHHYYQAPEVELATAEGSQKLVDLWRWLEAHPEQIPNSFFPRKKAKESFNLGTAISDYLAGMTDQFLHQLWNASQSSSKWL